MTEQNNAAQAADQEIDAIMEQAQVFASAWSILGGPFDNGSGLETAERERANLRALLSKLRAPVDVERAALAQALKSAQWGNVSVGNKALIAAAIDALAGEPVADERALIADATGHVTEALIYVDRVAQRKVIGYSDFGTNPRRHHNDSRPYNLKDARQDAYTAAILLRKAWDVLDPSATPRDATLESAAVADRSLAAQALKSAQSNIAAYRPPGSSDPESPQYDHDTFMWDYYQRAIDSLALASAPVEPRTWHDDYKHDARMFQRKAASAPVAGEAQPTDDEIIDMAVEPLGIDCDRMPYGVVVFARALLARYAAPQASEAARDAALEEAASICDAEGHEWDSDDQISEKNYAQVAAFRIRDLKPQRAALSAQPGAQKGKSDANKA